MKRTHDRRLQSYASAWQTVCRLLRRSVAAFCMLFLVCCTAGESGGFSGSGRKTSKGKVTPPETTGAQPQVGHDVDKTSAEATKVPASFTAADGRAIRVDDLYATLKTLATNDLLTFHGYDFVNMADFIVANDASFVRFADEFPTLGDYFDAVGISTEGEGTQENSDTTLRIASEISQVGDFAFLAELAESSYDGDGAYLKDAATSTWDCVKSGVGYVTCGFTAAASCSASVAQFGANPATDAGCVASLWCTSSNGVDLQMNCNGQSGGSSSAQDQATGGAHTVGYPSQTGEVATQ